MAFLSSAPTAAPPPSSSSSSTTAGGGSSGSGSGSATGGFVASSKFLVLLGALVVLGSSLLLSMQSTHVLKDVYKSLSELTSETTYQQGSSASAAHRERLSSSGGGGSSSSSGRGNANHNHYIDPKTGKRKDMNIVLFYADDWTWRTLGFVNKVVKTPHLDEMARRGMTFSHNCVTTSICWQSRATKSTGLYVAVHKQQRIWDDNIFDKTVLWRQTLYPQLFLSGYNVGFFGKW
jgi:Sulfatase